MHTSLDRELQVNSIDVTSGVTLYRPGRTASGAASGQKEGSRSFFPTSHNLPYLNGFTHLGVRQLDFAISEASTMFTRISLVPNPLQCAGENDDVFWLSVHPQGLNK